MKVDVLNLEADTTSGTEPVNLYGIQLCPSAGSNPLLRAIVWACSIIWVVTLVFPELMPLGALSWKGLAEGYWWQIVTHMFMHGGLIHLLFNMLALSFFVRTIEPRIGRLGWFAIFMAGGLAGGMTQLMVHSDRQELLVGASGGIMAIWGAMIVCAARLRLLPRSASNFKGELNLKELLIYLLVQMMIDQSVAMIAAYAHLGGLVAGALIAAFLPIKGSIYVTSSRHKAVEVMAWVAQKAVVYRWSGKTRERVEQSVRFSKVLLNLSSDFLPGTDFLAVEQQGLDWLSRPFVTCGAVAGSLPLESASAWKDRVVVADSSFLLDIGSPADADSRMASGLRLSSSATAVPVLALPTDGSSGFVVLSNSGKHESRQKNVEFEPRTDGRELANPPVEPPLAPDRDAAAPEERS